MSCTFCNDDHVPEKCPRVRAIEYFPNGTLKHVTLDAPTKSEPWPGDVQNKGTLEVDVK